MVQKVGNTVEYGLVYERRGSVQLTGFIDDDWVGCVDRKSTLGCCFSIGSGVVSWFSRKQKSVALSSTEAEYMAASMAACEGMWLRKLLAGLFEYELEATVVHCDNQSGIRLSENPVFHDRNKHRHQVSLLERLCSERNHSVGVHTER